MVVFYFCCAAFMVILEEGRFFLGNINKAVSIFWLKKIKQVIEKTN